MVQPVPQPAPRPAPGALNTQPPSITLPNKRPKLSPGASDGLAYASSYTPSQLVNYQSAPDYSQSSFQSFNSPQPVQSPSAVASNEANARPQPGTMGPPEKPKADKSTDINDLSDLVTAAGVDLRHEEDYLAATYRNQHATQATSTASTSFNTSQGSNNTITPDSSFSLWAQSPTGPNHPPQAGTPTLPLSQPAVPLQTYEDKIRARHREAARRQSEFRAKHLNDPFLQAGSLRSRIQKGIFQAQVRMDDIDNAAKSVPVQNNALNGNVSARSWQLGDGSALVSSNVNVVAANSPLADVLSLISLAAHERIRGALEDAYAAARARRYGSGGVVPADFADIAMGNGAPETTTTRAESITRTSWDAPPDSAVSPMTVLPLKRPHEDPQHPQRLPTPPAEPAMELKPTVRYVPSLPGHLQGLGKRDWERERARIAARKKRAAEKERRERQGSAESPAPNSPAAATTPSSATSKIASTEPKLTKKERERQAKAGQTDEVYHRQANLTASMALGKSKYSWMNAGSGAGAAPAIGAGAGFSARLSGSQAPKRSDSTSGPAAGEAGLNSKESYKKIGLLKEGSRVELRDIINVIEKDGREPKAILNGLRRLEETS